MVLDAYLLNTQHYKLQIKDKWRNPEERSSALLDTLVYQLLKKEPLGHLQLQSANLLLI